MPHPPALPDHMLSLELVPEKNHKCVVLLRHSKTDPFSVGIQFYMGCTGEVLCAVLGYLAVHPPNPGPLFVFEDGTPLSERNWLHCQRQALTQKILWTQLPNWGGHGSCTGRV